MHGQQNIKNIKLKLRFEVHFCVVRLRSRTLDVVAQLVEALRYKPEGCGFDSLWGHWDYLMI
jgi:hypothetical protein